MRAELPRDESVMVYGDAADDDTPRARQFSLHLRRST
jgi:hypothetical protein